MIDDDSGDASGGGSLWRWLGLLGAWLALIVALGVCAGFAAASAKHGFSLIDGAIMAVMLAVTIGLALLVYRLGRPLIGMGAHVPARERKAMNILIASFCLGLVIALVLAFAAPKGLEDGAFSILSNSPIEPIVALALCAIILIVIPFGSWQWHRIVDEHERDAYRMGAVAAAYVYLIGAPTWWFLWRGGWLPAPNGIIVYYAFCLTFAAVWLWKKYR